MILYLLVFISGFSSLVYEIVWMRALCLIYGNTARAAGVILALFMGGLALGAYAFGRWEIRRPLRTYGLLEGLVGLWGLAATSLLEVVRRTYSTVSGMPVAETIVQTALLALLILPPTFMMGASLPLLLRAKSDFARRGLVGGLVYGINTLGGLAGALTSGFLLVPLAGLTTTVHVAVAGNFIVFLAAVSVRERPAGSPSSGRSVSSQLAPGELPMLAAFALCGASSLALEVFWTRMLVLEIGSSVYAYSILLVTFLMGVGMGSIIGGFVADRFPSVPRAVLASLEILLALSVLAQYLLLVSFAVRTGTMEAFFKGFFSPFAAQSLALFFNTAQFVIVPTTIMGASFPLLLRACAREPGTEQRHAGRLYFWNTAGGVAGALLASILLIPALGVHVSTYLVIVLNLAAAAILAAGERRGRLITAAAAVTAAATIGMLFAPSILLQGYNFNPILGRRLVSFDEDESATVTVEEVLEKDPWRSISVNGVNVAGTSPDLLDIQAMQGHLPLLLAHHPRAVLHIGFGSGGTAYAVSRHPVREIQVAEISPAVIRQASAHFGDVNRGVLRDPRLTIWYGDGRNFLLRTRPLYDVILSDSIHPRYSGNGSLYTEDYYRLCRAHLSEGGVLSQWLPMYTLTPGNFRMILRAFVDVFPSTTVWYVHSTVNPFTVVIGRKRAGPPIPLHQLIVTLQAGPASQHLAERGHADPLRVLSYFIAGGKGVAKAVSQTPPHVDDRPLVEYESGRLADRNTWAENFAFLCSMREPVSPSIDWTRVGGREELERVLSFNEAAIAGVLAEHQRVLQQQAGEDQ